MGSLAEGAIGRRDVQGEAIMYVNGKRHVLPPDSAHCTLLEYLRGIGLTGTKLGCGEGGCGACTVMLSHYDSEQQTILHRAINACLAPLYSVEGMHVVTVEGIGNRRRGLHHVQEALANAHGSQCGFCTPGFVMSMYTLLRSTKKPPTQQEIEESLAGNLCRCTGYRPILDAFRVFAKTESSLYSNDSITATGAASLQKAARNGFHANGSVICPSTGKPCDCGKSAGQGLKYGYQEHLGSEQKQGGNVTESLILQRTGKDNVASTWTEPIFPPELVSRKVRSLFLRGAQGLTWYRPTTLDELLDLKLRFPDAKLVGGNTEVGIETRFKNLHYPVLIAVTHVPELLVTQVRDDGVEVGASISLAKLLEVLKASVGLRKGHETSGCRAFIEQIRWFAGAQIRNVACVGGNICTASPISDLNPLWIAAGAIFTVVAHGGAARSLEAKNFFIGYRKVDLHKGEILTSIFLPWTKQFEYVKEFKQAHRRDDDIALVNAGLRVALHERNGSWIVNEASLVYGGVAAKVISATKTQEILRGKPWDQQTLDLALSHLQGEIVITDNAPGGMVEFRRSLIASFFFKFFLYTTYRLETEANFLHSLPESYRSAVAPYEREPSQGIQIFQTLPNGTAVGLPLQHQSANLQVTGEAEYVDDIAMPHHGLHAGLVLSTRPHARIVSIDSTEAEKHLGFEGFFTAKDIPGANDAGAVVHDEEIFATRFVTCVGQVMGIVVADTHENAKAAAEKVKLEYEDLPAILDMKEAMAAGSFHPGTERHLEMGNVDNFFATSAGIQVVEGEVRMGGQEHFYLEPNSSLVWTTDAGNEVHMVSSTQTPEKHQRYVAHVLGIPMNKVVCKVKRIGGGFGGKETRSASLNAAAAVPAYLLQRPVRLTLDRDTDMVVTGKRHAFLGKYKVGFTKEGKILALDLEIYNNGGNSLDLSHSVLERAMFHSDNVYVIPHIRVRGKVCFTNTASNTAFRGFGGPQGMLIVENWIEHIACAVGCHPEAIRELNFQNEGYKLHYGQRIEHCQLHRVWEELKVSCEFDTRRTDVEAFNLQHRWKKRGVAMVPTKFGISFTTKFLNQAGALVQVYTDGTVLVTHGGVEMGQGLHTKMAQIAASALGIPPSAVFISETSTDKVPNASPTAASASSDMYGGAVLDACQKIKARMKPVADKRNLSSFAELANACYMERIDLSAHGFYITPDIGFDWKTGEGQPFAYFTYGAAFSEVELDSLTGDFHIRRVDIVMDLGNSLNPAIDIGQVEGAFVQGLGWAILEELKWGDSAHPWVKPGHLFTQGPGTYKLPTVNDIPIQFHVSLLKDAPNARAVYSSKAVGEPPLFLASATFFAIKDAIAAARRESGHNGWFELDVPATPERIRMACADEFTLPFATPDLRPKLSV